MQNALGDWSRLVNTKLLGANWMGSKAVDTGPNVVEAVHTRVDFIVSICVLLRDEIVWQGLVSWNQRCCRKLMLNVTEV